MEGRKKGNKNGGVKGKWRSSTVCRRVYFWHCMSNHWAPSGLISWDSECKKSVSLCVKLVQMPLSHFTLHLPHSPDGGAPAGVKWGRASLSSIHLMRRRRKSRDRRRATAATAAGRQLAKRKQKKKQNMWRNKHANQLFYNFYLEMGESLIRPFPVPVSPSFKSSTQGRPQACWSNSQLVAMRRITAMTESVLLLCSPPTDSSFVHFLYQFPNPLLLCSG